MESAVRLPSVASDKPGHDAIAQIPERVAPAAPLGVRGGYIQGNDLMRPPPVAACSR